MNKAVNVSEDSRGQRTLSKEGRKLVGMTEESHGGVQAPLAPAPVLRPGRSGLRGRVDSFTRIEPA